MSYGLVGLGLGRWGGGGVGVEEYGCHTRPKNNHGTAGTSSVNQPVSPQPTNHCNDPQVLCASNEEHTACRTSQTNQLPHLTNCLQVLCASNEEHTSVDPITPPEGVPVGERITFEGCGGGSMGGRVGGWVGVGGA